HRRSHHSDNVQLAACAPCAVRPSTWQPPAFPESAAIDRITEDSFRSRTFETGSKGTVQALSVAVLGARAGGGSRSGPRWGKGGLDNSLGRPNSHPPALRTPP